MNAKWSKIQSILKGNIAHGHYKVWIAPLKPVWNEESLHLYAPTEFIAQFVNSRFYDLIANTVITIVNKPIEIVIKHGIVKTSVSESTTQKTCSPADIDIVSHVIDDHQPLVVHRKLSTFEHDNESAIMNNSHLPDNESAMNDKPSPRPLPHLQLPLPMPLPASVSPDRNWRYTFQDFVVGPSNELAHAASKSICNSQVSPDMLYLSSAPGLGKTHLLHAVGKALSEKCNRATVKLEYITAEEFASQFVFSLKNSTIDQFKARYRNLDLLLLEDVHFLQGKQKTQAELLATIKSLQDRGSKIILTSSFSPKDLRNMDEQLLSRLSAGFLSAIDRPDSETRKRILHHKAKTYQVVLPDDVADMLSQHITLDVRQIESCLQNLVLKARLYNSAVTMQMAWEIVSQYAATGNTITNLDDIVAHVCHLLGLNKDQLVSTRRKRDYVFARNTVFYLARKHTDMSLDAIGSYFNKKHSTVLKGITNLEREISRKTPLGKQIANTLSLIERNGGLKNDHV